MKLKYIYTAAIGALLTFGMQSCYDQDMDHPSFDYPEEYTPTYSPLKFHLSFEDNTKEESGYRSKYDNVRGSIIEEGVIGKAYKGAANAYVLFRPSGFIKDTIAEPGSLTYAFWMKADKNKHQTGLFSITHKKEALGNFELFLDNGTANKAFFKINLRTTHGMAVGKENSTEIAVGNTTPEGTTQLDNVFGKWTHIAVRYNKANSTISLFKDGEPALLNKVVKEDFGPLKFNKENCGAIAIGAFGGLTGESDKVDGWQEKGYYEGELDECRLYNKALSDAEIKQLFVDKK